MRTAIIRGNPWAMYDNPMGVRRRNPSSSASLPATRSGSEPRGGGGGSMAGPVAIVAGTALIVGLAIYWFRRPAAPTARQGTSAPGTSRTLPPGAHLNEFGYPVGATGDVLIGSPGINWPAPGIAVGYDANGQLIDSTGNVITTSSPAQPQPQPTPVVTQSTSQMPPA